MNKFIYRRFMVFYFSLFITCLNYNYIRLSATFLLLAPPCRSYFPFPTPTELTFSSYCYDDLNMSVVWV